MSEVTFVNSFQVPPGSDEEFLALWSEVNSYARSRPGYLGHTLHRALDDATGARYVNVARWSSAEQFRAANDAHFRELVSRPAWQRFPFTPALYEVVEQVVATRQEHEPGG